MMDADDRPEIVEQAPAKINLYLHVNHRRDDGYHDLESLVVFTEFGDWVRLSPAPALNVLRTGPFATLLPENPEDDLCMHAARQMAERFGRDTSFRVSLEKSIPVAAGVGGGSADAAAVLRALARLWSIDVNNPEVIDIAAGLGADVLVCLAAKAAVIRGIGDVVEPVSDVAQLNLLLVNPNQPLSTASVFRAWAQESGTVSLHDQTAAAPAWPGYPEGLTQARNDLTAPAVGLCPVIGEVLSDLAGLPDCRLARMSGSGPTCFAVFETAVACNQAARALGQRQPNWWVCATTTRSSDAALSKG